MKTCGREPSSDLVLDQVTVSRLHARIELADDGLVLIEDAGSENGTFLNRNDTWIQIKRVTLCIGDRIRFGDCEVPLERITAVFRNRSDVRLEARHFPLRRRHNPASDLQKPRRNPSTGKIEDKQPV